MGDSYLARGVGQDLPPRAALPANDIIAGELAAILRRRRMPSGAVVAHALGPLAHREDPGVVVAAVEDEGDARALEGVS